MRAGELVHRVAFDAPISTPDGYGGQDAGFASDQEAITVWAHFHYLRGGEHVLAARLEGRQPMVVTVPNAVEARAITSDWRMRVLATGKEFSVRADPTPTPDRLYLEILVESGVAA